MIGQTVFVNDNMGTVTILRECLSNDGCGSFVLCVINNAVHYPFAVWFRSNLGDLNNGNYSQTLEDAIKDYRRRTN